MLVQFIRRPVHLIAVSFDNFFYFDDTTYPQCGRFQKLIYRK